MNQDSSFPPILPPSTELGALLFAVLPCLQENYRPLASFAYHMTELSKLKAIPSMPPLSGISGVEALISDKDTMLRSLSFYGKLFRMPLLSTIANLLQAMQFYHAYKDILPGLFSAMGGTGTEASPSFDSMAGLFSGLNGPGGTPANLFSALGGLSPEFLASLFSGFSGASSSAAAGTAKDTAPETATEPAEPKATDRDVPQASSPDSINDNPFQGASDNGSTSTSTSTSDNGNNRTSTSASDNTAASQAESSFDLHDSLYSFMTPEQKEIYEQLMHTD